MRLLTIALACLIPFAAAPAWGDPGPVQVGFKGGLNIASLDMQIDESLSESIDSRMGYGGGAELSFTASPAIGFEIDFLYLQKGAKTQTMYRSGNDMGQPATVFDTDYRLDYATIAPMLRFTSRRSSVSPYLQLGGEIGYLVSANEHAETSREGGPVDFKTDTDVKDRFAKTDFALVLGVGFEVPAGSSSFFAEGRYSFGLTGVQAEGAEAQEDVKTRGIYVLGGLRF